MAKNVTSKNVLKSINMNISLDSNGENIPPIPISVAKNIALIKNNPIFN